MYASCYILTKIENVVPPTPSTPTMSRTRDNSVVDLDQLEI